MHQTSDKKRRKAVRYLKIYLRCLQYTAIVKAFHIKFVFHTMISASITTIVIKEFQPSPYSNRAIFGPFNVYRLETIDH